ncbi:hypothetical protein Cgig2_018785 [Carnegiea gigantea]|uniref:Peptidase A2 domain-containing protein n=1 Tax=Carnegiea gigantea TaxID=171969 RepID=A0A9Q1K7H6_9CARY|nr:hypothetical protein Cgig2_018785 [Carnegiea gigantea]
MVFRGKDAPRFVSPHNDPVVVEMKIASAIVRRILVDTGSSVDIITWDFLKRLSHPERYLVPMANPILRFGGQEVNPTGMIRLLVRFGDKSKFKSLEVDVPTAYNIIIERPTLHRVKAVVAPDYTWDSPSSSCPSSSDAPASASKGLVASSSAASPSNEGGIPPQDCGPPQWPAHARPQSAGRPQNTGRPKIHLQGLARPCGGSRGRRSCLASSPTPWLRPHQPRPSPADAAALSFRFRGPLGLPATSHSISDIER